MLSINFILVLSDVHNISIFFFAELLVFSDKFIFNDAYIIPKIAATIVENKYIFFTLDPKFKLRRGNIYHCKLVSANFIMLCPVYVRDGDFLCITKLDHKQVKLHVIDQQIDTSTPAGMLLVTMLGAIAAFENDLRKERQADGIALAKRKGVQFGRKRALTDEQAQRLREMRSEGKKIVELMAEFNLSKATVYRALTTRE